MTSFFVGLVFFCTFIKILLVSGFSWLTCPVSYNSNPLRRAELEGPCEFEHDEDQEITYLYSGDRLKVGWVSNNQGGGWVRLSLVPIEDQHYHSSFDQNVIKVACFGYDEREDRFSDGYCNHPCNARPGCKYQEVADDVHRYDTTIGIPTNLDDGYYVLQWKGISSTHNRPSYSCSLLYIAGGSSAQNPCGPISLKIPQCMITTVGSTADEFLGDSKAGSFCFNDEGNTEVDVSLGMKPKNFMCDPRQSCTRAALKETCLKEMNEPPNPRIPLIDCPREDSDDFENPSLPVDKKSSSNERIVTVPLPPPIYPSLTLTTRSTTSTTTSSKSTVLISTTKRPRPTVTTTSSSSTSSSPVTTPSLTPTAISISPGRRCKQPISRSYCYSSTRIAKCVHQRWEIQTCPSGTNCQKGTCFWSWGRKRDPPLLISYYEDEEIEDRLDWEIRMIKWKEIKLQRRLKVLGRVRRRRMRLKKIINNIERQGPLSSFRTGLV